MGELQVTRWRRFGHDRLYVKGADGQVIGWHDLRTGGRKLERVEAAEAFASAVIAYCTAHGLAQAGMRVAGASNSSDPADGYDLAGNVPGQGVRHRAEAELLAMREHGVIRPLVARVVNAKTVERAWRVGADGEETVGARLEKLREHDWQILHSVPVGERGCDIDHILIGPGGVWTINTKNHPGARIWVARNRLLVNGSPEHYVAKSRAEALRASKLLSSTCGFPVQVRGALVILTGARKSKITVKESPRDVAVLGRTDVPKVFRRCPRKLSGAHVTEIFEAARRSTTWVSRRAS